MSDNEDHVLGHSDRYYTATDRAELSASPYLLSSSDLMRQPLHEETPNPDDSHSLSTRYSTSPNMSSPKRIRRRSHRENKQDTLPVANVCHPITEIDRSTELSARSRENDGSKSRSTSINSITRALSRSFGFITRTRSSSRSESSQAETLEHEMQPLQPPPLSADQESSRIEYFHKLCKYGSRIAFLEEQVAKTLRIQKDSAEEHHHFIRYQNDFKLVYTDLAKMSEVNYGFDVTRTEECEKHLGKLATWEKKVSRRLKIEPMSLEEDSEIE